MEPKMCRAQVFCQKSGDGVQFYEMFTDGNLWVFNTIEEVSSFVKGAGGHLGRIVSAKESVFGQRYREAVYYIPPMPQQLDDLVVLGVATQIWSVAP